jgi:hypothetical protein
MDRDTVISQYRERLNMSKPLTNSNLMFLVAEFTKSIASNEPTSLFQAELALLREGYNDQDIGNILLPVYREEISKQIVNGTLSNDLVMDLRRLMVDFETAFFLRPMATAVRNREPELIERDILDVRRDLAELYQAYWDNSELTIYTGDLKNATRRKIICAIDGMMKWNNNPDNRKYEIGVQTIHKITGSKDLYIREIFERYQSSIMMHNSKHNTKKRGRYNNDEAIRYCIDRLESIHGFPSK